MVLSFSMDLSITSELALTKPIFRRHTLVMNAAHLDATHAQPKALKTSPRVNVWLTAIGISTLKMVNARLARKNVKKDAKMEIIATCVLRSCVRSAMTLQLRKAVLNALKTLACKLVYAHVMIL